MNKFSRIPYYKLRLFEHFSRFILKYTVKGDAARLIRHLKIELRNCLEVADAEIWRRAHDCYIDKLLHLPKTQWANAAHLSTRHARYYKWMSWGTKKSKHRYIVLGPTIDINNQYKMGRRNKYEIWRSTAKSKTEI